MEPACRGGSIISDERHHMAVPRRVNSGSLGFSSGVMYCGSSERSMATVSA
jgi:hypothetical protein